MKKNKIICIVQARYSSTRFPGKILKKINSNITVLEFLIKRLILVHRMQLDNYQDKVS